MSRKTVDQAPVVPRWYCVTRDGLTTLCANERDARWLAGECDRDFPRHAPHRAVLLGDVAAAVAAERERCERNSEHEFELGRKRRFEFEPGFTRVMQCKRITSDWAAPEQWSAWKCVQSRSPARATEACADVAKPPDANEG